MKNNALRLIICYVFLVTCGLPIAFTQNNSPIFFEDFESGALDSQFWTASSSADEGLVEVSSDILGEQTADSGLYAYFSGKSTDGGGQTINTLDLRIDLGAYSDKDLLLEYWIRDYFDNTNAGEGIWLSDDNGLSFSQATAFDFSNWVDAYGKLPPLDLDQAATDLGLNLNDQFVIRFRHLATGDLNTLSDEDGMFLDNILIREETITYANLPFEEGFESGELSSAWRWVDVGKERGNPSWTKPGGRLGPVSWEWAVRTGFYALAMGRRNDGGFTVNGADLHLNLAGLSEVELRFWLYDFYGDNNTEDAIWVSDDGGASFQKLFQFLPENYPDITYQEFVLDLDSLVFDLGLSLSSQFILRFQQAGIGDFNTLSNEDGFFIDDISITGSTNSNAPSISSFTPQQGRPGDEITLIGQNFTPDAEVKIGNITAEEISFIDAQTLRVVVPALTSGGKISIQTANGRTASEDVFEVLGRAVIFFEDFETGSLRSMWTEAASIAEGQVLVGRSSNALDGFFEFFSYKSTDAGGQTINTLDLRIDLSAYTDKDLLLEYWIRDFFDDTNAGEGIWLSDDNGLSFSQATAFDFSNWVDAYGKLPPLDLDQAATDLGLNLNDQFVIRFRHLATGDLNTLSDEDGMFLDNILIREETITYANLPFEEGFESGELSSAWRWVDVGKERGNPSWTKPGGRLGPVSWEWAVRTGFYALAMGRRNDGGFTVNGADLHLNLAGLSEVELRFWLYDFYGDNNTEDAIWVSDDGGASFQKLFQFLPENYPDITYQEFVLDLDSLVFDLGLSLSSQFILRFQQAGIGDFNTLSNEDGFFIDDISITGSTNSNAPSISSFTPQQGRPGDEITLIGQNFTPDAEVKIGNITAEEISFIDAQTLRVVVPALTSGGKISIQTANGRTASEDVFEVLGRAVIFFEDFETGSLRSMWTEAASIAEGQVLVGRSSNALDGFFEFFSYKSTDAGGQTINTLDLRIDLSAYTDKDLLLEYWIRDFFDDTNAGEGIWLSDDNGLSFSQATAFDFSNWVDAYGKLPPLDLDQAATDLGLNLNDQFVIRFRHLATGDLNTLSDEDGMFLDNILIREETITYANLPFEEGFESGELSSAWRWVDVGKERGNPSWTKPGGRLGPVSWEWAVRTGFYALAMGRRNDGGFTVNGADLHLNLAGLSEVELRFWLYDFYGDNNTEDAIWVSDDGGASFQKLFQFLPENYPDITYQEFVLDLDSLVFDLGLSLSSQFILRFQQAGIGDFNTLSNEDGFFIDDISITGSTNSNAPSISSFTPQQGRPGDEITLIGQNFTPDAEVKIGNITAEEISFIDAQTLRVVVPALTSGGKISIQTANGRTASEDVFEVLGRAVIFFEDFETGSLRSMWTEAASIAEGQVLVGRSSNALDGFFEFFSYKSTDAGGQTINTLDLRIDLSAYTDKDLLLEYWIRDFFDDTNAGEGIWLSDDNGLSFSQATAFDFSNWVDAYGKLPPLDLDQAATDLGLNLNDQFVIRFRHLATGDLNTLSDEDGMFLDNILIREETITYANLPFEEGFESGELSSAWRWVDVGKERGNPSWTKPGGRLGPVSWEWAVRTGFYALAMGRRNDGGFTVNGADLHLNLAGLSEVELRFWLYDFYGDNNTEDRFRS